MSDEQDSVKEPQLPTQRTATTTRLFRLPEHFASSAVAPLESTYPGMYGRIKACLERMKGIELSRDLIIRMPRLEEVDIEKALRKGAGDDDLGEDIRKYISLLAEFNNYVGQGLEETVVGWLNDHADEWRPAGATCFFARNSVQFPDVVLLEADAGRPGKYRILFHMEVKTWYVFARDLITARFHTAPCCIKGDAVVLIFPWYMTDIVFGVPLILAPMIHNARELAERRDLVWESGGKENAVGGVRSNKYKVEVPTGYSFFRFSVNTQNIKSEAYQLGGAGQWVKDSDNFGKIHRLYYEPIYLFEKTTLGHFLKGRTLRQWRKLIVGKPTAGNRNNNAPDAGGGLFPHDDESV